MRANGVPKYPDPASGGQLPKGDAQAFDVSDRHVPGGPAHLSAPAADRRLVRSAVPRVHRGRGLPAGLVQQMLTADRKFAQCMRSHGVPNWPDPTIGANGGPVFKVSAAGITHSQTHSAPMEAS